MYTALFPLIFAFLPFLPFLFLMRFGFVGSDVLRLVFFKES